MCLMFWTVVKKHQQHQHQKWKEAREEKKTSRDERELESERVVFVSEFSQF